MRSQDARRTGRGGFGGRGSSSTAGLAARNVQASADALRRRQKANAAAKVTRHVRYKTKMRLLEELERKSASIPAPIVAAEFGLPGGSGNRDEDVALERGSKNMLDSHSESILVDSKNSKKRKHGGESSISGQVESSAQPQSTPHISPGGSHSSDSSDHESERRNTRESVVSLPEHDEGKSWRKKGRYQPFHKELAIAAARQQERVSDIFSNCSSSGFSIVFNLMLSQRRDEAHTFIMFRNQFICYHFSFYRNCIVLQSLKTASCLFFRTRRQNPVHALVVAAAIHFQHRFSRTNARPSSSGRKRW
jgi:hypothetical protein